MAKLRIAKDYLKAFKKLESLGSGSAEGNNKNDKRFYFPVADEDGKVNVLIRFLPSVDTEFDIIPTGLHGFKNLQTGKFEKTKCLRKIGKACPVCDEYWDRWKQCAGDAEKKALNKSFNAPPQKWITNILVIRDRVTPSNNGKVFLYEFGNSIKKLIDTKISKGIAPWDPENGINLRLKITYEELNGNQVPKYAGCEFDDDNGQTPIPSDFNIQDSDIIKLSEFCDPATFPSYNELKDKIDSALGKSSYAAEQSQVPVYKKTVEDVPSSSKPSPVAERIEEVVADVVEDDDIDPAIDVNSFFDE